MVVKHSRSNLRYSYKSKMHLQVKTKIESSPFYYSQAKVSPRWVSSPPRQRQITHSPQLMGGL